MAQLSGQWTAKFNGQQYETKEGSVKADNLGFSEPESVMSSSLTTHYKEKPVSAELSMTVLHMAGIDAGALNLRGANVELLSDTGEVLRYRNCAVYPVGIDSDELTVKVKGMRVP